MVFLLPPIGFQGLFRDCDSKYCWPAILVFFLAYSVEVVRIETTPYVV